MLATSNQCTSKVSRVVKGYTINAPKVSNYGRSAGRSPCTMRFSYSLDLEGRTYERGLISGYCDSLDVRLFPATFTPRQVLSRTTLGSQRSGKRMNAWFLPVSRCLFATNEAERAIGRKTASPSNRSSRDAFSNLSTPLSYFTNFQGITFRCRLCTR